MDFVLRKLSPIRETTCISNVKRDRSVERERAVRRIIGIQSI